MAGSIKHWPRLVSQIYANLKPGGWVEFQESVNTRVGYDPAASLSEEYDDYRFQVVTDSNDLMTPVAVPWHRSSFVTQAIIKPVSPRSNLGNEF